MLSSPAKRGPTHCHPLCSVLSDNQFGDLGAHSLARALESSSSLRHLSLKGVFRGFPLFFPRKGVADTISFLPHHHWNAVDAENKVRAKGACALANSLLESTSLTSLDLHGNAIGNRGAKALAVALRACEEPQLRSLDISCACDSALFVRGGTCVGREEEVVVAVVVAVALAVEWVRRRHGMISHSHCVCVMLSPADNHVGKEGIQALCGALSCHRCPLQVLSLGCEFFPSSGPQFLCAGLWRHPSPLDPVSPLCATANNLGDTSACMLAEMIRTNTSLLKLDLRRIHITAEGARMLVEALSHNRTLKDLVLKSESVSTLFSLHS